MSLITLTSELNIGDPRPQNASYIKNHFKDGIQFRTGDTIALVSLTINKLDRYEIIQGSNDTLIWRIGARASYEQHIVTIPQGAYTGFELATVIQTALNASTIIGLWQYQVDNTGEQVAGWSVIFNQTDAIGHPTFTIDVWQQATPTFGESQNPLQFYSGEEGELDVTEVGSITHVDGYEEGLEENNMDDGEVGDNVLTGINGIFANGGVIQMNIDCIKGMNTTVGSFTELIYVGAGDEFTFRNYGVPPLPSKTGKFTLPSATAIANHWDFMWVDDADPADNFLWHIYTGDEEQGLGKGTGNGSFRCGLDENNDATLSASWDYFIPEFYFNYSEGTFQDVGRSPQDNFQWDFERDDNGSITNPMTQPLGYCSSKIGYQRQQLYNGPVNYPMDPNAMANMTEINGSDIIFSLSNEPLDETVNFSITQMTQVQGSIFPNAGWRTGAIKMTTKPDEFINLPPIGGVAPANWTNFDIANGPSIRIKIELTGVRNLAFSVAHDTNGGGSFVEKRTLMVTSSAAGSPFASNIKESFYPLRPILTMGLCGWYERSSSTTNQRNDRDEYVNPNLGQMIGPSQGDIDDANEAQLEADATVGVGAMADPPNAISLSSMWKFGTLTPEDLVSGGGDFPDADLNPNLANVHLTIGMPTGQYFSTVAIHNPVASTVAPVTAMIEPSLSVELQDFNCRSHNGFTGDNGKAIAIVPKEELFTNEKTGVLHYYAQFPIDIDLKIPQDQTLYSLTSSLRLTDGTLANDLLNPTSMTLLHKEGDESKQARILEKALSRINGFQSDVQQNQITTMGSQFPRV